MARILSWREAIRANGSSAKQADAVMRTLSETLADAVDAGKLPTNPAAGISRLATDPVRREALSAEQAERIRAELPALRDQAFWGLLCVAGLRTEEAVALRWSDVLQVSPTGGTLTIGRVFVAREFRDTTKTRKGRDVPIVAPLGADLTEPLKSVGLDTDAWVCPSRTGTPVNLSNWRWRVFRPATIVAEVPSATPPVGRHTSGRGLMARQPLRADDVMTAREVAEPLHVSQSTVEDWGRRGVIPSRKIGRHRIYIRSRIEAFLLDDGPQETTSPTGSQAVRQTASRKNSIP